jgi:hypothetical protein
MTLLLLLLIPLGIGAFALWFGKGKVTWKEFLIQEGVVLLVIGVGYAIALSNRSDDIEHWNGVIAKKEVHNVTCCHDYCCVWGTCCSRTGKTTSCSPCCKMHCKRHGHDLRWDAETSNAEEVFSDGCNSPSSSPPARWTSIVVGEPTSVEHNFTNYVKGNPDSILRRTGVAEKWTSLLPEYPRVYDHYRANKLIAVGWGGGLPGADLKALNFKLAELNGRLGAKKGANITLVIARTADAGYAEALSEHWLLGKKNDLTVVIGAQSLPRVDWVKVLSWSRSEEMKISIRDRVLAIGTLDLAQILKVAGEEVESKYVRRKWEDFDYLKATIEPSSTAQIVLFCIGFALSIGLWILFHRHDVFDEERYLNQDHTRNRHSAR